MVWKSVGIVDDTQGTLVLQQRYVPPQNQRMSKTSIDDAAVEPDSVHRLVPVTELVDDI